MLPDSAAIVCTHNGTRCTERRIGVVIEGFEWEIWLDDDGSLILSRARRPGPLGREALFTVAIGIWTGERIEIRRWFHAGGTALAVHKDIPLLTRRDLANGDAAVSLTRIVRQVLACGHGQATHREETHG